MVCQKLNGLSFADKKQSRRSDRMTLGAFLMTYFTLRKCSFGHPRRSMRTSAPVDADICVGRCGHLRRSMRTSASVDAHHAS